MPAAANLLRARRRSCRSLTRTGSTCCPTSARRSWTSASSPRPRSVLREAIARGHDTATTACGPMRRSVLAARRFSPTTADWSAARRPRQAGARSRCSSSSATRRAWRRRGAIIGAVHANALRYGEAAAAVEHGPPARPGGRRPPPNAAILRRTRSPPSTAPRPCAEAIEGCSRHRADAAGDRRTEGLVLGALAHLEAMRGEFDRARELYGPSPLDARGAGKQRARCLDLARGRSGRAPRRQPGRGRAPDPKRRGRARADGRRLPALDHGRRSSRRPSPPRAATPRPPCWSRRAFG